MSNTAVGPVYEQIINDVVETSRVDFEEYGVDDSVMNDLRRVWQEKLSNLNVASFPWDPKPDATPVTSAQQQAPPPPSAQNAAANYTQAVLSPGAPPSISLPQQSLNQANANGVQVKKEPTNGEPVIKQEPGSHPGPLLPQYANPPTGGPVGGINVAQQRAAQHLDTRFGTQASASIQALKGGMAPQSQRPQVSLPPAPVAMQNFPGAQQQQQQSVSSSQVDGPSDGYKGVVTQRNADGSTTELGRLGRVEIDRLLHDQVAAKAKRMQGGGLMVSLKSATKNTGEPVLGPRERAAGGITQLDGVDDDFKDEDAEDAINSELDDPEDDNDESEDDDETLGQQMLCLYDKVQRVKNKWKCTLRDGILTVNGKEYVFHKGTGEYEW